MNLSEIRFPVFKLSDYITPQVLDGVIFYSKEYTTSDVSNSSISIRIIDDKNVPGSSLGVRRLNLFKQGFKQLYPIRYGIYYLVDLIKQAKVGSWFIDSNGNLFKYKKLTRAKLSCHRVKKILPINNGMGIIVEVEGIPQRFKCLYRPEADKLYVGILKWGLSYLLYGFYDIPFKSTYRLV